MGTVTGTVTGTVRALYGHCTGTVGGPGKTASPSFSSRSALGRFFCIFIHSRNCLQIPQTKNENTPSQKNARVEPGSPDGLPLSKKIEEVGIITDSPTNISTWPSTYLCLGRPGTLKRAHIQIRVACFRRCATPVPPLLLLTPGFKGTYASPEPWHGWPHPVY